MQSSLAFRSLNVGGRHKNKQKIWCWREALGQGGQRSRVEGRGVRERAGMTVSGSHKVDFSDHSSTSLPLDHCLFWLWREDTEKFTLSKHNWCPENCSISFACHDEWWVHTNKLLLERQWKEFCLPFRSTTLMLAHQPEIITWKIQPSTVLTENVCGALEASQAPSEAL